jgi:hypothetical protein
MEDAGAADGDDVADPGMDEEPDAGGAGGAHAEDHDAEVAELLADDVGRGRPRLRG